MLRLHSFSNSLCCVVGLVWWVGGWQSPRGNFQQAEIPNRNHQCASSSRICCQVAMPWSVLRGGVCALLGCIALSGRFEGNLKEHHHLWVSIFLHMPTWEVILKHTLFLRQLCSLTCSTTWLKNCKHSMSSSNPHILPDRMGLKGPRAPTVSWSKRHSHHGVPAKALGQ